MSKGIHMSQFVIDHNLFNNTKLPDFTITLDVNRVIGLYSDAEVQTTLVTAFSRSKQVQVFDYKENLYERLTVKDNVKFYKKWFQCPIPLAEIVVMFHLQHCLDKTVEKCTVSEIRRIYYAKQFMSIETNKPVVFVEPLHGIDVLTKDTFFTLLRELAKQQIPVCNLVTNMEHAILLGDEAFRLTKGGLHPIEIESEKETVENKPPAKLTTHHLSKIPAKVEDKVILFDPLEIDYIESQEGQAYIVVDEDYFLLDSTLTNIEKQLVMYGFFRCHRSYIVNLQKVREIITWSKNTYSLRIDNKKQSTIPLSRAKIKEIQEIFSL